MSCTRNRPGLLREEGGTAVTETIILTWIMLVFFAAAYQMFIVNETIYRSIVAVHSQLMNDGFKHNCYETKDDCWHDTDKHAHVIWRERDEFGTLAIPEIRIIAVRMFQSFGLTKSVLIRSNVHPPEPSKGCSVPCKKTKMGAGAGGPSQYYTKNDGSTITGRLLDPKGMLDPDHGLIAKSIWAAGQVLKADWLPAFKDRFGL